MKCAFWPSIQFWYQKCLAGDLFLQFISARLPNDRVNTHVSLSSRTFWALKVMYRVSVFGLLVERGFYAQTRLIGGTLHVEGCPLRRVLQQGLGGTLGKPRSRGRCQAQELRTLAGVSVPCSMWFLCQLLFHGNRLTQGKRCCQKDCSETIIRSITRQ